MMESPNGSRYAITMGDGGAVGVQRYYDAGAGPVGMQSFFPSLQGAGDSKSDLQSSSTESVDFVQKLVYEVDLQEESNYLIRWYYESTMDTKKKWCDVRVILDGVEVLGEDEYYPAEPGLWKSVSGFSNNLLTAGTHTIAIEYRSQENAGDAKIRRARIHITKS